MSVPALQEPSVAERVTEMVRAPVVSRSLVLGFFQRLLRGALARASDRGTADDGWHEAMSDSRLSASHLRPIAWTVVLADTDERDPASRAAALVAQALAFRDELAAGDPELRVFCERLFGTCLVPGSDRFTAHRGAGDHILVGANGGLFSVPVASERTRESAEIRADLAACLATDTGAGSPVLTLTAMPREQVTPLWEETKRANPGSARAVEDALFSVFFDPARPADIDACGRLAHAGDTANRCYWHTMQLIVFANGKAAVVGSFVGGVEGRGVLELGARLGKATATVPRSKGQKTGASKLEWTLSPTATQAIASAAKGSPVDVGGLVVVEGSGRRAWAKAGRSGEAGVVLALSLALSATFPDLDELECMVSLAHLHRGLVLRLGSTTHEMLALREAARSPDVDLGAPIASAIAAHRARAKAAKRGTTSEGAFELATSALSRVRGAATWLRWTTRLLAWLIVLRTPASERARLPSPLIAVNSSMPLPAGVVAIGRFGIPGPPRRIWVHHSLADDDVRFVLQLSPEHLARAAEVRAAIARAVARVLSASRVEAPSVPDDPPLVPTSRLAYRRLMTLLAALAGG